MQFPKLIAFPLCLLFLASCSTLRIVKVDRDLQASAYKRFYIHGYQFYMNNASSLAEVPRTEMDTIYVQIYNELGIRGMTLHDGPSGVDIICYVYFADNPPTEDYLKEGQKLPGGNVLVIDMVLQSSAKLIWRGTKKLPASAGPSNVTAVFPAIREMLDYYYKPNS